ncbi:MAG: PDZ domain-containing protein, partial [Bdellovibrionia bacterium]
MTGYFRYPAIFNSTIAFVSEDDIWSVPLDGGVARRLTSGLSNFSRPHFSPDGKWLAVSSSEEGHMEIFVMPAVGGEVKRLTYLGSASLVVGWKDNETILFSSIAHAPHRMPTIYKVSIHGGAPESMRLGPSVSLCYSPKGEVVLERNSHRPDPAHWKRYRGGTAGNLWYATNETSEFRPLLKLESNLARPLWAEGRIYFVSDHEDVGNIYSCDTNGKELRAHTRSKDFYARNPATDGKNIVYHAGGDLFTVAVGGDQPKRVPVEYHSQRTQRQRKFLPAAQNLEHASLDTKGRKIAITSRGQSHAIGNWDGPVMTLPSDGSRYRLADFMGDDKRVLAVTDRGGEEQLEIFDLETKTSERISDPAWGRFTALKASPKGDKAAFANHRNEFWLIDLKTKKSKSVARSLHNVVDAFNWSPDGRWVAFGVSETWNRDAICIADSETFEFKKVSEPMFKDFHPSFDPGGKYLYFLSQRELNPVYDEIQHELSFPKVTLPCLVTLQKETVSPFLTKAPTDPEVPPAAGADAPKSDAAKPDAKTTPPVKIDFDGITERVLSFPVPEARYERIFGLKDKAMWLTAPVMGALERDWLPKTPPAKATVEAYDFNLQKPEVIASAVSDVSISKDASMMLIRAANDLRVVKAGEKVPDGEKAFNAKSGWIEVNRIKNLIDPAVEWNQMLGEIWRLQRDHYWREDMNKIDWSGALRRYLPLVSRVNSRGEFGDLVWELQGELGTSHAYDIGGDYRWGPQYLVGLLGADFEFDLASGGYKVASILRSDVWNRSEASPLRLPGVDVRAGDIITAINGKKLDKNLTPHHALWHKAGEEVEVTVKYQSGGVKNVRVRTLADESKARYRDWVEANRTEIAKKTGGRVGYIHIPD